MPNIEQIIKYEQGAMDYDEMVHMFQCMINDGSVWRLQGHYGRTAKSLIDSGACHVPGLEGAA